MGPTGSRSGHDSARAEILNLVRARITPRFRLTEDALVDRIVALPAPASRLLLDDLYLASACAAGEDDAWREFQQKHFAFIRDFAARFLRGAAAEDLAADVLADLWQRKKIAQFEGRSTLRTWLGAVVTRSALNVKASKGLALVREAADAKPIEPRAPAREHDDDGVTLARLVHAAIDRLEPEEKLMLLFHYEQGLSLDDMEPLVGLSKATLSRRLKRIRETLRSRVETQAVAEGGPRAAESLAGAIGMAQAEFDLAAVLASPSGMKGGAGERV